ncbi:MAG: enoyl-CoA hydratase-related protein [Paracoccaceae bacterium]
MSYDTIIYTFDSNVATITMNRPEVMNGLNEQMRLDLLHAVRRAESEARVLILTGIGGAFCSGQDLADSGTAVDLDIERVLREEYEPLLKAIYQCRIPTIAAVNGAAAGAGANLALATDIVIASESAFFVQAFARIGLVPDAGGSYWLPRQVGFARAMGAALFAEKIPAKQAESWGMIWEAVPDGDFVATVRLRATLLAEGPTRTYAYIKQAIRASFDNSLDEQLDLEATLQGKAGKTRDFVEGVMAFMEKRPANYEGR